MWKSLFVTRGDVLVFMDADLLDWDTHFVPGLLGPLLTRPEVALVKGFYERPLLADGRRTSRPPTKAAGSPSWSRGRCSPALSRARRAGAAAGRRVGGAAVTVRLAERAHRVRRGARRADRHRAGPAGSTRSRRSTSAVARTGTRRCATSARWRPRSLRPRLARLGVSVDDPVALRQYHPVDGRIGPRHARGRRPANGPPAAGFLAMTLKLGRQEFDDDATLMMAIVNRTPDSFYDKGATWAEDKAFDRVAQVVDEGAEIVDIGGIKAAPAASSSTRTRRSVGWSPSSHGCARRTRTW